MASVKLKLASVVLVILVALTKAVPVEKLTTREIIEEKMSTRQNPDKKISSIQTPEQKKVTKQDAQEINSTTKTPVAKLYTKNITLSTQELPEKKLSSQEPTEKKLSTQVPTENTSTTQASKEVLSTIEVLDEKKSVFQISAENLSSEKAHEKKSLSRKSLPKEIPGKDVELEELLSKLVIAQELSHKMDLAKTLVNNTTTSQELFNILAKAQDISNKLAMIQEQIDKDVANQSISAPLFFPNLNTTKTIFFSQDYDDNVSSAQDSEENSSTTQAAKERISTTHLLGGKLLTTPIPSKKLNITQTPLEANQFTTKEINKKSSSIPALVEALSNATEKKLIKRETPNTRLSQKQLLPRTPEEELVHSMATAKEISDVMSKAQEIFSKLASMQEFVYKKISDNSVSVPRPIETPTVIENANFIHNPKALNATQTSDKNLFYMQLPKKRIIIRRSPQTIFAIQVPLEISTNKLVRSHNRSPKKTIVQDIIKNKTITQGMTNIMAKVQEVSNKLASVQDLVQKLTSTHHLSQKQSSIPELPNRLDVVQNLYHKPISVPPFFPDLNATATILTIQDSEEILLNTQVLGKKLSRREAPDKISFMQSEDPEKKLKVRQLATPLKKQSTAQELSMKLRSAQELVNKLSKSQASRTVKIIKNMTTVQELNSKLTAAQEIVNKLTTAQEISNKLATAQELVSKLTSAQELSSKLFSARELSHKLSSKHEASKSSNSAPLFFPLWPQRHIDTSSRATTRAPRSTTTKRRTVISMVEIPMPAQFSYRRDEFNERHAKSAVPKEKLSYIMMTPTEKPRIMAGEESSEPTLAPEELLSYIIAEAGKLGVTERPNSSEEEREPTVKYPGQNESHLAYPENLPSTPMPDIKPYNMKKVPAYRYNMRNMKRLTKKKPGSNDNYWGGNWDWPYYNNWGEGEDNYESVMWPGEGDMTW